jgi:hypothetical protein
METGDIPPVNSDSQVNGSLIAGGRQARDGVLSIFRILRCTVGWGFEMRSGMRMVGLAALWAAGIAFVGCGGSGSGSSNSGGSGSSSATAYNIGGTVSGLSGSGLVLQDDSVDDLTVSSDGAFTFSEKVAQGTGYSVTVLTQPSNPPQNCAVANGSGTATANIANVQVT